MLTSIAQKLRIKEDFALLTMYAPADFEKELAPLPAGVKLSSTAKTYDQIHWFVKDEAAMKAGVDKAISLLKDAVICWIYYPKGTSKIQSDLTRDNGWESLLQHDHLHWISLISFNDTWSAFGMRLQNDADKKKASAPKERALFKYIDAAKKTIRLPDDFSAVLDNNSKEKEAFNALSFSNKKEYIEWIASAKRDETKAARIKESIERLAKGYKNPANR